MERITIDVSHSIHSYIMFFLRNLPGNLITIIQDTRDEKAPKPDKPKSNIRYLKQLQGKGKELYRDIDSDRYLKALRSEW